MLNEKQYNAIDYLVTGAYTKQDIAKLVGTSERTIYNWLKDGEFKAELHRCAEQYESSIKREVHSKITGKLDMALDNIVNIAIHASSDKVRLEANQWIYEMICGKATTKVADVTNEEKKEDNFSLDELVTDIKEVV